MNVQTQKFAYIIYQKITCGFSKLLIAFILFTISGNVYAQNYQWAKDIKSEGFDEGYDLATDAQGNTYVGGMIEFDTDFGNGIILHSAGIHDIFLAKYDSLGKLVWARRAGGKGGDKIQSVALDGFGNIYAAGEFEDTSYWGNIMKVTNADPGVNNMFIAKYDTTGNVLWVRNISATGILHTRGYGITCDAQGNVYACGGMKGDAFYDNIYLFSTAGDYDGTVFKFDPNGNFVWGRRMGGTDSDKAYGVVSDNNGSIYVTGYFVGNADFSPTVSLTGRGHTDIFLAKYDTSGSLQWVKQAGDTGFDRGWDIIQNVNGQIVITGEFQTGYFGNQLVHSRGNEDMFLAAYDSNGNNIWALSGGGEEDDIGRGVTHDAAGNVIVIGDFASRGIFQPDTIYSNGYADVFVACYNSSGTILQWVRGNGGHESDRGRGVGTDASGNVYVCGEYVDSIQFGNNSLTGDTLLDIFVARLNTNHTCFTQVNVTAQNTCNGMCNGTAIASANGQGPFTYLWSTNPPINGRIANNLCAGTYTVTSTDMFGCSSSASVTITDPPPLQASASHTNASCAGSCNGLASVTATGNGPFTYLWSTQPAQTTPSISGLCQGNYSVTITDVEGCTTSTFVTLTDPLQLQVSTSITNATCSGFCNGTASLTASGNGPFTYQWSTTPVQTGSSVTGLCQGNYTVVTTDAGGCSASSSVTLTDPLPLQASVTAIDPACSGNCDGTASVSATGQGPITYLWSTTPPQTGANVSSLCGGTYTVTCTDVAGCTTSAVTVLSDPAPLLMSATISSATCIGCSDGSIDLQISGGTGSYQYVWSNGITTQDQQNIPAGVYQLCVTDANNCSICDSFAVTEPASGTYNLSDKNLISVFPNPFQDFAIVRLNKTIKEKVTVSLYTSTGQLVNSKEFSGNELVISSNELSNGIYFLNVFNYSSGKMQMIPLIIQK